MCSELYILKSFYTRSYPIPSAATIRVVFTSIIQSFQRRIYTKSYSYSESTYPFTNNCVLLVCQFEYKMANLVHNMFLVIVLSICLLQTTLAIKVSTPEQFQAYTLYNKGVAQEGNRNLIAAQEHYRAALQILPDLLEAHNNIGGICSKTQNATCALHHYTILLDLSMSQGNAGMTAVAYNNLGLLFMKDSSKRKAASDPQMIQKALTQFDQALALDPSYAEAWFNRGNALFALEDMNNAIQAFKQVLIYDTQHCGGHLNMGNAFLRLRHPQLAFEYHAKAAEVCPYNSGDDEDQSGRGNRVDALNNVGASLKEQGKISKALNAHKQALLLRSDDTMATTQSVVLSRWMCEWESWEKDHHALLVNTIQAAGMTVAHAGVTDDTTQAATAITEQALTESNTSGAHGAQLPVKPTALITPYDSLLYPGVAEVPGLLARLAELNTLPWSTSQSSAPNVNPEYRISSVFVKRPLPIGYLSFDMGEHPMGHLTLGLLEHHNRSAVRAHVFSYGTDRLSAQRERLINASDEFVNLFDAGVVATAESIRQRDIQVVFDLMGHTTGAQHGILALRPAPVIINYLGFPGTSGALYTDSEPITHFSLVDRLVAPPERATNEFTDRLLIMPPSYQANKFNLTTTLYVDAARGQRRANEAQLALRLRFLPSFTQDHHKRIVVLCNLNGHAKFDPRVWGLWMNIMQAVPHSILVLLRPKAEETDVTLIKQNLRTRANLFGIDSTRIVFVPKVSKEEHVVRMQAMDLFVDTLTYGAHSTGSDALWAGLPMITMRGNAFASRVGISLLHAVGLGTALVAENDTDFVQLGTELLTHPYRLNAIRRRLGQELLKRGGLFDAQTTTQRVEACARAAVDAVALARTGSISSLPHVVTAHASGTSSFRQGIRASAERASAERASVNYFVNLDDMVQQAAQAHRDGRLDETKALLSRMLAASSSASSSPSATVPASTDPTFQVAEAWHQNSLVELLTNNPENALMDITKAIYYRPNTALYHGNAVHMLQALGMTREATASAAMAVRLDALSVMSRDSMFKHDNLCGHVQTFVHLITQVNAIVAPTLLPTMDLFSFAHPAVEHVCTSDSHVLLGSFLEAWADLARMTDKQTKVSGLANEYKHNKDNFSANNKSRVNLNHAKAGGNGDKNTEKMKESVQNDPETSNSIEENKRGGDNFNENDDERLQIAPEVAVQVMKRLVALRPNEPRLLYKYGVMLHEAGYFGLALDAHLDAVRQEHALDFEHQGGGRKLWKAHEEKFGGNISIQNKPVLAIYCFEYGQTWWPNWGPQSPDNGGAGGSEEAVIFIARELTSRFRVQVYADPPHEDLGIDEHGVEWLSYKAYNNVDTGLVDVFVAWRYHISLALASTAKKRFLWLQDMVEGVSPQYNARPAFVKQLDGVFALSRFHLRALPQPLQTKSYVTPNALNSDYWVDGANDATTFIYASSPNRGLEQVLMVWPDIRRHLGTYGHDATLHVYYGFSDNFVGWAVSNMKNYSVWRARMDVLLSADGVYYHGMVNHRELALSYASAGFSLYPTSFPETGCVSLMKAQALGAIPITSRYSESTLPEMCGEWDLGPEAREGLRINEHPDWLLEWRDSVINASLNDLKGGLKQHREAMIRDARRRFLWSSVADTWTSIVGAM